MDMPCICCTNGGTVANRAWSLALGRVEGIEWPVTVCSVVAAVAFATSNAFLCKAGREFNDSCAVDAVFVESSLLGGTELEVRSAVIG